MSAITEPSELEYENLAVHVDKCSLRYEQMKDKLENIDTQFEKVDKRFDKIEERMGNLETDVKKGNKDMIVALIGATAVIISALTGIIIAVI
jgi:predicted  nucleic acid-binding Zn-ribbon protein